MATSGGAYLIKLHKLLNQHFSLEEIRTLCLQLNIDYESVAGNEKPSQSRELLLALARHDRLSEFVTMAQRERPHIDWPSVPHDFQLPVSMTPDNTAVPLNHSHVYSNTIQAGKKEGDKISGDHITLGNISGSAGVAIGRGASASVHIWQGLVEDDLNQLFAPLLAEVAQVEPTVVARVKALKAEVAREEAADDERLANLISEIARIVPTVVDTLTNLFTKTPIARTAGEATNNLLGRIANDP